MLRCWCGYLPRAPWCNIFGMGCGQNYHIHLAIQLSTKTYWHTFIKMLLKVHKPICFILIYVNGSFFLLCIQCQYLCKLLLLAYNTGVFWNAVYYRLLCSTVFLTFNSTHTPLCPIHSTLFSPVSTPNQLFY